MILSPEEEEELGRSDLPDMKIWYKALVTYTLL